MNTTLQNIPQYLSKKIADLAAKDPDIVNMSIGEPFFSPPKILETAWLAQLQQQFAEGRLPNKHAAARGDDGLRRAIADRYQRLYQVLPDAETDILVTHGVAEAIWLTVLALTDVGDEVLIPDPSYMLYEIAVRILNRVPVRVPSYAEDNFVVQAAAVKKALGSRTRLMFINSPENPTGAVYDRDTLTALGALADQYGFYLAHDEVYDTYAFRQPHANLLHSGEWPPYLILLNSFSKRYAMMGWRIGWMAASEQVITEALKVHTNLTLNLNCFNQQVAGAILNNPGVNAEMNANMAQVNDQLIALHAVLSHQKAFRLPAQPPAGGLFLFPDVTPYYNTLPADIRAGHASPGEVVAAYLLERHKIAVVPGYVYGAAGVNHVRIVAAVPPDELKRACDRFQNFPITV